MTMRFRFESITSTLGANNAGKSQLLRDLVLKAQNGNQASTVVLREAESELVVSDAQEAGDWLERHAVPAEYASVPPRLMFLPSQNQW
ncbi:hypothetical protein IM711_14100 [Microbacterium esteraromaticum]|uniref:hypothetical protein n=1 Tax=Microbacterium esteraromaticum TaxID=57043 RepID=UPI003C2B9A86